MAAYNCEAICASLLELGMNLRVSPCKMMAQSFPLCLPGRCVEAAKSLVDVFLVLFETLVRRGRLVGLSLGLPFRFRNLAKIVPVKKVRFALPANSNNFADADVYEMLEELIKSVVGVAPVRQSVRYHPVDINAPKSGFDGTYTTMIGPRFALCLIVRRTRMTCRPIYDFPVPGGP